MACFVGKFDKGVLLYFIPLFLFGDLSYRDAGALSKRPGENGLDDRNAGQRYYFDFFALERYVVSRCQNIRNPAARCMRARPLNFELAASLRRYTFALSPTRAG